MSATQTEEAPARPAAAPAFEYRPGLTHLRALSVVLVLLFHAEVVKSGYIGVDVFFVLSGFLISNILWEKLSGDDPTHKVLGSFYARRCLRILPLSLLVLAVTALASHFFFETLIDNWTTAGRAALVWSENWFLIRESNDYFAPQGTNPFQQYWSLGVEEQFYVVLPLLMMFLLFVLRGFNRRARLIGLAVAAGVGVVAALASSHLLEMSESEAYYSSFVRSYQLLAGVLIMAAVRVLGLRDDRRWLFALGVVGLIVVGGFLDLSTTTSGLIATVCAGLCVLSSKAVLVDSKWLERLGLWSYGMYLWHFPISAYLTNETKDTSPWLVFAIVFVTATALAAFTFRFFENPVRHLKIPTGVTFAGTGITIACLWVALGLLATPAPPTVYASQDPTVAGSDAYPVKPDGTLDLGASAPTGRVRAADVERVEGWMPLDGTAVAGCGLRDVTSSCIDLEGTPKVMLLGDSFANRIYQGLRPLAEDNGWGLSAYVRPGCPWMDDVYNNVKNDISDRCASDKHLQQEVIESVDPDIVVIHSYPYREANNKLTRISTGEVLSQEQVAQAANDTIDRIEATGAKVVFVEPTPFAEDSSNVDDCLKLSTWADECDFQPIDVNSPIDQAMRDRAETDPEMWFSSINDLFCDEQTCRSVIGSMTVMGDETHVSGGLWVRLRNVIAQPIQEAIDTL
ncbi:MAG TPA: acyltransferase family protein [Acidimicrobiales bacterium]|nr:acyltransferase family protein [Acidimicrobiales bacterium]